MTGHETPRLVGAAAAALLVAVAALPGCRSEQLSPAPAGLSSTAQSPVATSVPLGTEAPDTTTSTSAAPPATMASTTTTVVLDPLQGLALDVVSADLHRPVYVAALPDDGRIFVVQQEGRVVIIDADRGLLSEPFLDIRDRVAAVGIEQGLLGLAFHPDYAHNGRFFVYYTDRGDDSRLAEFTVTADPDVADPASERLLLGVEQPTVRHNAGMIQFGPDGYLYVAFGDGGAARDNAQDPATLLGTIVRLDVDSAQPYAIPPDNPFVDGGGAAEVWAYGLRNPWRFWIDAPSRRLYVGDVGQSDWEEIDVVPLEPAGWNLGWAAMEGEACFLESDCDPAAYVGPVVTYGHDEGCSVTGGLVYRGQAIPELIGRYFYGDWCGGWVRSFYYTERADEEPADRGGDLGFVGQITAFGQDGAGEILVATWEGSVLRIVPLR